MSETPDLSTLPKRMRYAADVLQDVLNHHGVISHFDLVNFWSPGSWRYYAASFEAEEKAAAEHEQQVEQLAKTMCDGVAERVSTFAWGDDRNRWNREIYRQAARAAIAAGWTKAPL